ncbi:MAG: molybdate ABC transporter substrate-binding protein [Actinobacteria bacterium]|nr:molybdate ABC transporter substrate-binding protein [Actinomycetota bacterium]
MRLRIAAALAAVALLGGCSSAAGDGSERLTVFAAASLTEAFTDLAEAFEDEHPGVEVTLSLAGSPDLAAQIEAGAGAEVFASADDANMERIVEGGFAAGTPEVFATNGLTIVVEAGNPKGIEGLDDLAADDLIVSLAAPEVPAGRYAAEMLDDAGIAIDADSFEVDVKAVVARVALGEADAGIVFATDVAAAGDEVSEVRIPKELNVIGEYPIVVIEDAGDLAEEFVSFVLSNAGVVVLRARGFGTP